MKFRLHPILAPFFLFLAFTGGLSYYALIFISLLLHEAGHLIAARMCGMSVQSCTIMPYGGELRIHNRFMHGKMQRIFVAISGPLATMMVLLLAMVFSFPGDEQVVHIQFAILLINLLPILPLDGGQAISALLETADKKYEVRTGYLLFSIFALLFSIAFMSFRMPETILFLLLALFLLSQNVSAFQFRKYEQAYEKLIRKQLTP
ncbi:M50 family metallopeptidase [Sporosarcina saromensis]|uniref:M50 family metallopeptidase n=1 Tax=Sporosarcina saromensis TaxID=359365 RepID=A0ABU4G5X8_9BACL|nr:M50 family metallopeptidase [Sporosarcina saromensis]MDW0112371.1 M50 family metallopeptidase [Sporosarcina saromensis]